MKTEQKEKAIWMRQRGESIKCIAKTIGAAQSSVSVWVRDVVLSQEEQMALFARSLTREAVEKRRTSRLKNEEIKRRYIMDTAGKDLNRISLQELKLIGIALYWAEGGKTRQGSARISNSDPIVIQVMMKFFREVCNVDEKKFRGHIHLPSPIETKTAESYWSSVSEIPLGQFYKTYTKPSSASQNKRDKLPFGTFDIYVCSTKLYYQIMGWIEKMGKISLE